MSESWVIRVTLTARSSLPVFPDKQTLSVSVGIYVKDARNGLTLYSLQAHRLPSQSYCAGAGMGRMLDTFQPLGAFTDHQP
jgi:hypothetical protein